MPAKILIADDDRDITRLVAMSLQRAGYLVMVASGAAQAFDLAQKSPPDLCILDLNMPAGGGQAIRNSLCSLNPNAAAPVIYLTGDKSSELPSQDPHNAAFQILYKPIDTPQLLHCVRTALDRSQACV